MKNVFDKDFTCNFISIEASIIIKDFTFCIKKKINKTK